ncbi:MAG: class I SAM-dependent methyltransferase [Deltaproteobacteria bacterium]|nr:class I SAM-dependent methyltransferase [Deltaproteobacteria bacterium]
MIEGRAAASTPVVPQPEPPCSRIAEDVFAAQARRLWSPAMGTEHMGPLLYSLVRFCRPRRVLEIGAGYTSAFLLRGLADNAADHRAMQARRAQSEGREDPLALPRYYEDEPEHAPRLYCLDTLDHPHTTAAAVPEVAQALGLDEYLRFVQADFRGYAHTFEADDLPFDLVWMDAGSYAAYRAVLDEYWRLINPAGGLWLIHSTQTNLEGFAFIAKLKLLQASDAFNDLEILSLLEPHKLTQNSVSLVRRTTDYEERIFTARA